MELKRPFFFLFILCSLLAGATAQNLTPRGKKLADLIYEDLNRNGISARKLSLFHSEENNFPYNIHISVNRNQDLTRSEEKTYNTILFVFSLEEIYSRLNFLYDFIQITREKNYDFNINILLSSSDRHEISGNENMTGTQMYCDLIEGTESQCAVPINFTSKSLYTISAGSNLKLAPLWLLKLVTGCLEKNQIYPVINGDMFISLYKIGILSSSIKLSAFLSSDIPAVEVNFPESFTDSEKFKSILSLFIDSFNEQTEFNNDVHYIPIKISNHYLWIGEGITIIFLISTIILCLLIISDMGFLFRKKHSQKNLMTKRSLRSMYLIPGTIIISTLFLLVGQFFSNLAYNLHMRNLIILLGIKVIISIVLVLVSYLLELKIHKKASDYSYGYLVSISSFLNIFIFSAIDITFFYLFALIYIIFVISRLFKKTVSLYIFLIISILPYFLLLFESVLYSSNRQILPFILSKPLYNLALSCALTPVYLTVLRIISNFNIKDKKEKLSASQNFNTLYTSLKSRFPKYYILFQVITVAIFIGAVFVMSYMIRKQFAKKYSGYNMPGQIVETNSNSILKVSYKDSNYYGGTIRRISIDTGREAVRVDITVSGQSDNPVYYSTNIYEQIGKSNQIQFKLPDYPPQNFTISYTPDNSNISIIRIAAYYPESDYPEELIFQKTNSRLRRKIFYKETAVIAIDMPYSGDGN